MAEQVPQVIHVEEVAAQTAANTQTIAEAAHTTISNALTTPTVEARRTHDTKPSLLPNIVIDDPEGFEKKRQAFIAGGHGKLQVIADFDRTLSAFTCQSGKMCAASHELLESCVGFNKDKFLPAMAAINTKYFALEVSHEITEAERAAHMNDWWNLAHALLLEQGIQCSAIEAAVSTARTDGALELRKGAKEFLHRMNDTGIPVLVFSAGLKETIRVTLQQLDLLLPCMHLIGNEMHFDGSGKLERFGEEVITSSNKNYSHVITMQPDYHTRSSHRRNVILIGDNIGDSKMANGMEGIENIIRIGLLHEKVDLRIDQFKQAFDVVLLHDSDLSFLHELVEEIIKQAK